MSDASSVTVPAPMWRLEGDRDGTPCSEHPPVVQAAVDRLAGLAVDPNAAAASNGVRDRGSGGLQG